MKIEHVKCNAQMNPSLIKEFCAIDHESLKLIQQAYERFGYSARCYHKFLKQHALSRIWMAKK